MSPARLRSPATSGFSFIEILACLLILGLGVTAAVGMVMYGVLMASRAQGRATGMATAMSVAADPTPLLPKSSTWNGVKGSGEASGYINNFYVVRHETRSQDMVLPDGFTSSLVSVDVYDTFQGHAITSFQTRVLRQSTQ
jgi:prepilin-type N-terminal cleavage/methylation domain-containing protein